VFGALLNEQNGGAFAIRPADGSNGVQSYITNTNVLTTTFTSREGSFRVVDFAPRFELYSRSFRPTKFIRIVEPLTGTPRIRVLCAPVLGWTAQPPRTELGSHHISYAGYDAELRLTTDAPLSYLKGEPFALTERKCFVLSWGSPVEEPLPALCDRFLKETVAYWQRWVKQCDIPPLYQDEVIRSALALKLHCFEDTGAIVAATTTSIPESPGSGRTWDYRYCWLRDAYYTLNAFRLLGQFEEREQFLHFLLNVASAAPDLNLPPLYRVDGSNDLDEQILPNWPGFQNEGPVRIGNQAASHRQNDVFGEMILALSPLFLDARFKGAVTPSAVRLVSDLAEKAAAVAGQPDAGIWEFRSERKPQTFTALMCWAGLDRTATIAQHHTLRTRCDWAATAAALRQRILAEATCPERHCLVAEFGGRTLDAALLQAVTLRFFPPGDPHQMGTVDTIRKELDLSGFLKRYNAPDDFGTPAVAFTLCSFWLVEALAHVNRLDEARLVMERLLLVSSPLGLLSEDLAPDTGALWGNFPQAYSHAGVIHAAFAAAPSWSEVL